MRTHSVKSVKLTTEKNTRLDVRMKNQARCKSQESVSSTCPKNLLVGKTGLKPFKDVVLAIESKTSTRTLPNRLNSEPRDLKDIDDILSSKKARQPRPKDSQSHTQCDETFLVKLPIKENVPCSSSVLKVVPIRPQISNVNLVKQLKKKDSEIINSKQKLNNMERLYPVSSRTRTNDPNKVLEKEVKSRKSFDGIKANKHSEEISNLNKKMDKLEIKISGLHQDISRKDSEIQILRQKNSDIQEKLSIKIREINDLQDKLKDNTDLIDNKHEIVALRHENLMLEETVSKQKEEIVMLKKLTVGKTDTAEEHYPPADLEKETADFLEKVSTFCKNKSLKVKALSKDKNVKINLKVTVRKERLEKVPHQLSFSEAFESPAVFAHTPCQTFSVREDDEDEVFCDTPFELPNDKEVFSEKIEPFSNALESIETCKEFVINESPPCNDVLDVNLNSDYPDVSIGTFNRADELDQKMQQLWTRLSSQNVTLDHLKSENRKFITSVEMLEEELSESFVQHKRLVDQVSVVKQLFC